MPRPQNRHNSLPCTFRIFQTKVVQSKGWLSVGIWLGSMIYWMGLWTRCVVWSLVVVRMAIELRYHTTP